MRLKLRPQNKHFFHLFEGGFMRIKFLLIALLLLGFSHSQLRAEDDVHIVKHKIAKKHGWLGVSITDVTPKFARENDLKIKEGAYVNDVVDDSPADSAGIKEGDVITEFNGKKIEVAEDLSDAVGGIKPGTKTSITLLRNDEKKNLSVVVGKLKMRMPMAMGMAMPRTPNIVIDKIGKIEGMELMELNSQLAEYFQIPGNKGVLVKAVEKNSSAEKAGVKAGDVITKIEKSLVTDLDDIHESFEDANEGDKIDIETIRKGKTTKVSLEVTEEYEEPMMWQWNNFNVPNFQLHGDPEVDQQIQHRIQKKLEGAQKNLQKIERKFNRDEV